MTSSDTPIEIGIQLPTVDGFGVGVADIGAIARAAETAGFSSVWVGDHFSFHAPVIEAIVAASVAAGSTESIGLGFGVLLPAMRHPAWLAKQVSSLQAVSGDRVILGVGVGGEFPAEWKAVGVPVGERGARTDAFLQAAASLLAGEPTELGPPWDVTVPPLRPAGQMPSMWVGGRSDAALRRAIKFGTGWMGLWLDEQEVVRRSDRLREIAAEARVPTPRIGCAVMLNLNADVSRAHEKMARYMEAIYRIPYARLEKYTVAGDADTVVERLAALVAAGVSSIVLLPTEPDVEAAIGSLAEVAHRVRHVVAANAAAGDEPFPKNVEAR